MELFNNLISNLRKKSHKMLPGREAQFIMAPRHPDDEKLRLQHPENSRKSGVMLLLYPSNGPIYFITMERADDGGTHSKQISLPGGKYEEGDIDLKTTALRETHEEVGVSTKDITTLLALSPLYIPPSEFLVYPYVGFTPGKPVFVPDPKEVASLLEVDLDMLLEGAYNSSVDIRLKDNSIMKAPSYLVNGKTIWGATAMIISEFVEVLRTAPAFSFRN